MTDNFQRARDLFVQGVQEFEANRLEQAEACFLSSLALLPGRVSTLTNLAATQTRLARPQDALVVLDQALAAEPGNTDAWWHRGMALGALGQHESSLAAWERFLGLRADHAEAWLRHGQALQQLERHEQALSSYDKALALNADLAQAWTNRGGILKDLGRLAEAATAFRQAITHGGDAELNGYFLASVLAPAQDRPAPPSAPAHYVQSLFDHYAESFDTHLVKVLHYQAHTLLVQHLQGLHSGPYACALDLGCGTGLCGPLVRPLARQLDGVDLSPQMLDKARAIQIYDRLVQADIVDYLHTTDRLYDLVLAADVFIYVGELSPVFRATASAMASGGIFCFSAETAAEGLDFELKTSLRYGQSESYLRALAERHGFDVVQLLRLPIREDAQQSMEGLYLYLRRR